MIAIAKITSEIPCKDEAQAKEVKEFLENYQFTAEGVLWLKQNLAGGNFLIKTQLQKFLKPKR
ncbi:MAG: hypothetical protein U0Y10_17700 [Spirosomataceae bacterium]